MSPIVVGTAPVIEFADILRRAGLNVVETPGWRTRSHPGAFTPIGMVWHHTGGLNALDTVLGGRSDLAGPLANLYLDRHGTFYVVAAGVAWHAGPGSQRVLEDLAKGVAPTADAAVRGLPDDCSTGNHSLVGIEVENLGTDPYPDVQIAALVLGSAALCKALAFTENACIHHREWTSRKVDMSFAGDLRTQVAAVLAPDPIAIPAQLEVDVIYVIEAPGRSPGFFTADGVIRPMGSSGWTFINRFARKHPNAVVFDKTWTAAEYDLVAQKA
jgi:hypothetical protein